MLIADQHGRPTHTFHQYWARVIGQLEEAFGDISGQVAAIAAAQADATAAQADATAAAREAGRIGSYTAPTNALSAADVGATATITIAAHTRIYPVRGTVDVDDVNLT